MILWKKLFVNCAVNALSMVTGKHLGELSSDPYLWEICTDVIQECVKVAEADGTSIPSDVAMETVKEVCENNVGIRKYVSGLHESPQDRN